MYDEGIGVKSNLDKAIYWYEKACTIGNSPAAAYNLMLIYKKRGDKNLALKYLRRSAEIGYEDAQQELKANTHQLI